MAAVLQGFETAQAAGNVVETDKTTSVLFTMKVGALTDTVQVRGDTPIVDVTNTAANTRVRRDEFEKIPIGRSYQALVGTVPGVVGTGNVNALGALTSSNLFIIDAVDTTDPTTGTFGTNLNFEAIQEVSVYTSGVSAEYGRAQRRDRQRHHQVGHEQVRRLGQSHLPERQLERPEHDDERSDGRIAAGASSSITSIRYTRSPAEGRSKEPRLGIRRVRVLDQHHRAAADTGADSGRLSAVDQEQVPLRPRHRAAERGTHGLGEVLPVADRRVRQQLLGRDDAGRQREALTSQDQTAKNWAAQYSGVLRNNWSMEAAFADYSSQLFVGTFEASGKLGNAPIFNEADNKYYNGATFDGFTDRPRQQFNIASNWFLTPGGHSHDVKVGLDFQNMKSGAEFKYPNAQLYDAESYQSGDVDDPGTDRTR